MKSEARTQQDIRIAAAKHGAALWRNNVGATPATEKHVCPRCNHQFETRRVPVRYGLANESHKLNEQIKSADLIGITPRLITPPMTGGIIGQFTSIEVKPEGWKYSGTGREQAQRAWLDLVRRFWRFG
jgi:hypothetical protein